MPLEKKLGSAREWVSRGNKQLIVERDHKFVYVPILEVLHMMLKNDALYEQVITLCLHACLIQLTSCIVLCLYAQLNVHIILIRFCVGMQEGILFLKTSVMGNRLNIICLLLINMLFRYYYTLTMLKYVILLEMQEETQAW